MADKIARKFLISGDVQGVGYRYFARRAAAQHQVVGYAKNLRDGRVEVVAEGPREYVESFKDNLATGPRSGSVERVEETEVKATGEYSSFTIEF